MVFCLVVPFFVKKKNNKKTNKNKEKQRIRDGLTYNEGVGKAKKTNNKCRQLSRNASLNILSGVVGSV